MQCPHCRRSYARSFYFARHVLCCKLIHGLTKEDAHEQEDTPSVRDLYLLVQELTKQQSDLTKRLKALEGANPVKKAKGILATLQQLAPPTTGVWDWCSGASVDQRSLETLFTGDYTDAISGMMAAFARKTPEPARPFRCYTAKSGAFYAWRADEGGWSELTKEEWARWVNLWVGKTLDSFKQWQDTLGDEIYSEKGSRLYHRNVKKVMGGSTTRDTMHSRLKTKLYTALKVDLKSPN